MNVDNKSLGHIFKRIFHKNIQRNFLEVIMFRHAKKLFETQFFK